MKILIVAGEASADMHAAHVIESLQKNHSVALFGVGGDRLISCGLKPLKTAREMAVVGLTEALRKIPQSLKLMKDLEILAVKEKVDFAFLLDLPDFNLRLAPRLKLHKIPVLYYISPQVWAWRSKRVHYMAKVIDRLLCILPFEKTWFEKNAPQSLDVRYVGHPVLEEVPALPYEPEENLIALLPGSREGELQNLLPELLQTAVILKQQNPALQFVLPLAEPLRKSILAKELLSKTGIYSSLLENLGDHFHVVEKPACEVLRRSKLAIVASGTATLETAVVGTPMIVVYRVAKSTAFLFRYLVRYQGPIAMANLVHVGLGSKERVVPELLQEEVMGKNIALAAQKILNNQELWNSMRERLAKTRSILSGSGSPVDNVVKEVLEFMHAYNAENP